MISLIFIIRDLKNQMEEGDMRSERGGTAMMMNEDVDVCVTLVSPSPPILPLRAEFPSLGVECVYGVKRGEVDRVVQKESLKKHERRVGRERRRRERERRGRLPLLKRRGRDKEREARREEMRNEALSYEAYNKAALRTGRRGGEIGAVGDGEALAAFVKATDEKKRDADESCSVTTRSTIDTAYSSYASAERRGGRSSAETPPPWDDESRRQGGGGGRADEGQPLAPHLTPPRRIPQSGGRVRLRRQEGGGRPSRAEGEPEETREAGGEGAEEAGEGEAGQAAPAEEKGP